MELFPAIDLRDGKAVRLLRGDYDQMTVYSDSPVETAKSFEAAGAGWLHLVDLDGAKSGNTPNFEIIKEICESCALKVEVGGGIRNIQTVQKYVQIGVSRVILGTAAATDPAFLQEAVVRFGEKIAVGVDLKDGRVAIHGWTESSGLDGFEFCDRLQRLGVRTIVVTDISRDGAMQGVNLELYKQLREQFSMDIIASGGVTDMSDLLKLDEAGVYGAIMGKSLYTGSIDLKTAIETIEGATT